MAEYKGYLATLIVGIIILWMFNFVKSILSALKGHTPGPRLAKITALWKLTNLRNGSYMNKLRDFHEHTGVVQIGPNEYSVSIPRLIFQRIQPKKIASASLILSPQVIDDIGTALQMANVFRYEPLLEKCNLALLRALLEHAENDDEVDLCSLIARYAYDTMFCTTTGSSPGFLEQQKDVSSLIEALETWKFYSILYGSYFRFHPNISALLQRLGLGRSLKSTIAKHLNTGIATEVACVANELRPLIEPPDEAPWNLERATLEASIALMTSGADPVITHLLASIYFTYHDQELVEALRDEIEAAGLSEPPKLKQLIHAKPQMPLLHAVLQESLRLIKSPASSFISPKGGIEIGRGSIPEECTICCEPSIAHVNPNIFGTDAETFNPSRWLEDPAVARGFRNHMIAFGAGAEICPGTDLHLSIVAKIFTQIVSYFDFEMASVDVHASPINLTFNDFKGLTIAKVVLPKNVKPLNTSPSSPLKATAPAFAPETTTGPELPPGFSPMKASFDSENSDLNGSFKVVGKYAARIGDVREFIPNAIAHGSSDDSTSPTMSVASTAKSSDVSSTPMSWSDEQLLEDLVGRETTNKMMNEFDPTSDLTPRPLLKTCPILEPRNRYLLHNVIERIWGGRLVHETSRRDNCMFIWVPGSKLPFWLNKMHQSRQQRDTRKQAIDRQPDHLTGPGVIAPERALRTVNSAWGNFAQDENTRYTKIAAMSGDEYAAAERKKAQENGEKRLEDIKPTCTFKETFKQTGVGATNGDLQDHDKEGSVTTAHHVRTKSTDVTDDTNKSELKTTSVPPHLRARPATPPHLRSKSPNVDQVDGATDIESGGEKDVWCAAKLPSPCSSD